VTHHDWDIEHRHAEADREYVLCRMCSAKGSRRRGTDHPFITGNDDCDMRAVEDVMES
jgi:hypothetical protein